MRPLPSRAQLAGYEADVDAANEAPTPANAPIDPEHARVPVPSDRAANEPPVRVKLDATRYLDFVRRIATRMARSLPSHVSLDDLIGAGTLGLLDAMDRYDPAKADRFETFAEFRIKGAILDELRRYDLMARNARLTAKRLARKTQELIARLGRPPTEAELAQALEMSIDDYRKLVDRIGSVRVLSFDDLSRSDDGGADRIGELSAKMLGPDEAASVRELHTRLRNAIAGLPERQQMILDMYYQREMTLKEIGMQVGVTESRVCQIMGEATGRLRHLLKHS
jgi:RNA polymerase sigma factor FliA